MPPYRSAARPGELPLADAPAIRWVLALSIAALAFSYQLTTPILLTIGADIGADKTNVNLAIKGGLALAFGCVAVAGLAARRTVRGPALVLIAYLAVLGIRLLYDTLVLSIVPLFQTEFYVLAYYFGLTIVPILAILLTLRPRDTKIVHDALFWMLVAANITLLVYIIGGGVITSETVFAGRFEVAGDEDMTAVLNPIGVSAAGSALAAMAIGRLAVLRSLGLMGQAFAMAMIVLGVINMFAGGSRGPALALVLVLVATVYTLMRVRTRRKLIRPRQRMWVYGAGIAAGFAILIVSRSMSVQVFDRFSLMFESRMQGGREERDLVVANALADFRDSPFIGSSYLTTIGQQYPHNIAVDALMATGVIGFGLFAIAMLWMLRGFVRMLHGHAGPHGFAIALMSICVISLGMTSGAAWQSPDFWVIVTAVFVLGNAARRAPVAPGFAMPPRQTAAPSRLRA